MSAVLRLVDLTAGYDRRAAVRRLSGTVEAGSLTAIVGPNGAGKSTLLKALAGVLPPLGGRVELGGLSRRDIAYLPQTAEIERSFPVAVGDVVQMGAWRETGAFRAVGPAVRARARDALEAVGLGGFERRLIGDLSAGQFQRVLFARLLLQDARLILLDEPFAALDARTTRDLVAMVAGWHGEGRTLLIVLHDLDQVRALCPETLLLAREAVAWGPTGAVLSAENLFRARAVAEAWDEPPRLPERSAA